MYDNQFTPRAQNALRQACFSPKGPPGVFRQSPVFASFNRGVILFNRNFYFSVPPFSYFGSVILIIDTFVLYFNRQSAQKEREFFV